MKVIDLLNKMRLFNDYRPNVKFKDRVYLYDKCLGNYSCGDYYGLFSGYCIDLILDDETEIIEEDIEEDKPIEKILLNYQDGHSQEEINEYLRCEINEIIDVVNKLKKESDK